MKFATFVALLAILIILPPEARAETEDHNKSAQRYIATLSMRRILTPIVAEYVSAVPAQGRLRVANEILGSLDNDRIHKAVTTALIQAYTEQELDAMAVFFGSPVGQSILDKNLDFTSYLNLAMREELLAAINRALKKSGH
jgi:hypothetical protein